MSNEYLNDLKSEFSVAFIRSIAYAVGHLVQEASRMLDADGVDLLIFSHSGRRRFDVPRLIPDT